MIVDECHYGATFQQAQDTYVNDYNWQGVDGASQHGPKGKLVVDAKQGPAEMLQRGNVLTLLVSATPYCMLTSKSRLPSSLYVSHSVTTLPEGLKQLDVLKRQQPSGQWGLDDELSKCQQREAITLPPERVQELIGQQVRACGSRFNRLDCCYCCTSHKTCSYCTVRLVIALKVLKELHVVDWSDCDTEKVPYRRIEDYVASMTKPKADQHGLVHDLEFDKKFDVVRSAAKCKL